MQNMHMRPITLPNNITIAQASPLDSNALYSVLMIAEEEKNGCKNSLSSNSALYQHFSPETLFEMEMINTQNHYYAASYNEPFPTDKPVKDREGRHVCGFGAVNFTEGPDYLIELLYTVRSPNPIGTVLLQMFISQAKAMDKASAQLQAITPQAVQWYQNRAGFQKKSYNNSDMILPNSEFSSALYNLEKITGYSF